MAGRYLAGIYAVDGMGVFRGSGVHAIARICPFSIAREFTYSCARPGAYNCLFRVLEFLRQCFSLFDREENAL